MPGGELVTVIEGEHAPSELTPALVAWLEDKHYLVSASTGEGVPVSVLEGMAKLLERTIGASIDVELHLEQAAGEVRVDVPGLDARESTAGESARVEGTMGGGGAQVTLRARGDVVLEPGSGAPPVPAEQE